MGQQFRIQRTVGVMPVVSGGAATMDLPRGYDYEALYLRVYGGLQVTTAATAVRAEAPCQSISRVEVVADGRNTIFSAPFWYCVFGAVSRPGMLESGSRYTTPPSAVGVATYQVEANGCIDFQTVDGERPKDTNFRTSSLQLLQLRLTFGAAADNFVGGVVAFNGLNVEIGTSEMVELPDAAGKVTSPNALAKTSFQEIAVPSSNANQEIRLPAGNLIKQLILRTEGNPVAGEPTTAVLQSAQAFSGVDVRLNLSANAMRAKNNNDFGYVQAGYYVMDFTRNGSIQARLSELWDVTRQAEPKISMNITGGASVKAQVVVREYIGLA